jgi:hypothetical protein
VLIADENYPRGQWPLAMVTEVMPGEDGYVRTVKVKTSSTVSTRANHRRRGENKINTTILTRPVETPRKNVCACTNYENMAGNLNTISKTKTCLLISQKLVK